MSAFEKSIIIHQSLFNIQCLKLKLNRWTLLSFSKFYFLSDKDLRQSKIHGSNLKAFVKKVFFQFSFVIVVLLLLITPPLPVSWLLTLVTAHRDNSQHLMSQGKPMCLLHSKNKLQVNNVKLRILLRFEPTWTSSDHLTIIWPSPPDQSITLT